MKHAIALPGVVAGVMLGLVFMALNTFGSNLSYGMQEVLGLGAMAVAVAFAGVRAVHRLPADAFTGFPARYFTAMLTSAITAIVHGVIAWLYFAVIDPRYLERFYAQYLERARDLAADASGNEQLVASAGKMKDFILDPFSQAMVQFGTVLMLGVLVSVVVAALVKPRA